MAEAVQHRIRDVGLHLRNAPADSESIVIVVRLFDLDPEALLEDFATSRPYVELHDVFAVAKRARWTVKCIAAAQRVHPVGKRAADILPRQTVMRLAEALIVQHH